MDKKRKQTVGHDPLRGCPQIESKEDLAATTDFLRTWLRYNRRAARWKAAAKRWRQMANEYWLVLDKEKTDD